MTGTLRLRSVLCILCPVLSLLIPSARTHAQDDPPAAAIVNGDTIPFSRLQSLRNDYRSERKGLDVEITQRTDDDFFLQLVDDQLIAQEAARRGISVDRRAAVTSLLSDPPDFIRSTFTDAQGNFRRDLFRAVVSDPDRIVEVMNAPKGSQALVDKWKSDLDKLIDYVRVRELKRQLRQSLYEDHPLTPEEIRNHYFAEKTHVTGSFVRVLHSTIPDSAVDISLEDARKYYQAHREDYDFHPARQIASMIVTLTPTRADSLALRDRMDSVQSLIRSTPPQRREQLVTSIQRGLPSPRFSPDQEITLDEFPKGIQVDLRNARPGDLIGPYYQDREAVMLYVDRTQPSRDTLLRGRHVFLKVPAGNAQADSASLALITTLRDSIDDEEEFKEAAKYFSQDNTNETEGDLGYFGRGTMVKEFEDAAFNAPIGKVIGPVRTEFGYHLIYITDRVTQSWGLRELRFPITVRDEVRDVAMKKMRAYGHELFNARPADSMFSVLKGEYPAMILDTAMIEQLQPYGDELLTGEFAFSAKVGDVAILPLPFNRIAVIQVLAIRPGGIPEFEQFPHYVAAQARRAVQLKMLRPRIEKLADSLTPDMLIGPMRSIAPMAEVFLLNDETVKPPPDESDRILDSLAAVTQAGQVSGPVLGTHAYYFLRVQERSGPTAADYQRDRQEYTRDFLERYRKQLLEDKLNDLRAFADITDLRKEAQKLVGTEE